jgi:hypothetical protein
VLQLTDRAGLAPDVVQALSRALEGLTSLQAVLQWAFARTPPSDVREVVVQDEYSHDVVIPWRDHFLVFDTT